LINDSEQGPVIKNKKSVICKKSVKKTPAAVVFTAMYYLKIIVAQLSVVN